MTRKCEGLEDFDCDDKMIGRFSTAKYCISCAKKRAYNLQRERGINGERQKYKKKKVIVGSAYD